MPAIWHLLGGLCIGVGLALQAYLRAYPYIKSECYWPANSSHRILAFGDPQITGHLHLQKFRKKLDILGNDRFLAQVAEATRFATQPEYAVILGDLLSSQWISTEEFHLRADRYETIFDKSHPGQIVNISGNHDIGYHGELTEERISRFEQRFGQLNYVVHEDPSWRLVVLNSLSLDGPPFNDTAHNDTLAFLESLKGYEGSTVLVTHIPLYKTAGVCRDGPRFEYYSPEQGGGLKQQNHLGFESTNLVLNSLFNEKGGVVLAGHDHEGCVSSYSRLDASDYNGQPFWESSPGLRQGIIQEMTVRSVMGEFGGNTALISSNIDPETELLHWNLSLCRFHVQHVWWAAQVISILGFASLPALLAL